MRDIIAQNDFEFEEFDPTTAALENPEIEVPRSYSSNLRLEKGRNIVRYETPEVFEALTKEWAAPKAPRRRGRAARQEARPADATDG